MNELIVKLSKEALVVMCVGGFNKKDVERVEDCEYIVKFYMKDGRVINGRKEVEACKAKNWIL